jgi:hypothetical protein
MERSFITNKEKPKINVDFLSCSQLVKEHTVMQSQIMNEEKLPPDKMLFKVNNLLVSRIRL